MLEASLVICTHNPRRDYLARVLAALRDQTLPPDRWELLIVDNASDMPVAEGWDLESYPQARHLVEPELGIAAARRRGMREAAADLIVFVDDDNVLDRSYLSESIRIKEEWPLLGAWASGSIEGDYEVEPAPHLAAYLPYLAIGSVAKPRWSNVVATVDTTPWGAGLCVRREIARDYCRLCEGSSIQMSGRPGGALIGGEDKEIVHVCAARGLGAGIFPELKIKHLIPAQRISKEYLIKLVEGAAASDFLLNYKWKSAETKIPGHFDVLLMRLQSMLLDRGTERRIRFAQIRAIATGRRAINRARAQERPAQAASRLPMLLSPAITATAAPGNETLPNSGPATADRR